MQVKKLVYVAHLVVLLLAEFALIALQYQIVPVLMQTILLANALLPLNGFGTQQLKQVLVSAIQLFQ